MSVGCSNLKLCHAHLFICFFRYLYTDETDLSEEHGIEVMHIAHKYQVTTCLGYCSKFQQGILRIDNVCVILETARLLDDKALERSAINFMDDHADEVLQSDGFSLHVGADTLKYILTGNTLFAKEISIVEAVDKWATKYVEGQGIEVNATNKRNAIGDAFQYLRFPTMSLEEFVTVQLKYNYLTTEEERDIFSYLTNQSKSPIGLFTVSEAREPRQHRYFIPSEECRTLREDDLSGMFGNSDEVSLACSRDIELTAILISLQVGRRTVLNSTCIVKNEDVEKIEEKILWCSNSVISMSQPISLRASKNPYTLKVSVTRREVEPTPVKAGRKKTTTNTTNVFGVAMPIQQRRCISTQTDPDDRCSLTSPLAVKLSGINTIRGRFIHGIRYMNMSKRDQ